MSNEDLKIDKETGLPFPPEDPTPWDALDEFYKEIQTERFKPIPTGIRQLDEALDGGLVRKTLVTLASAPGMGKTAISQYVFENMAKEGHPVIYVNLEMDRSQLLSRSIARISYELNHPNGRPNEKTDLNTFAEIADITTTDIKRGYEWTDAEREKVNKALDYYRENIAPRFHYVTTNPENKGHITNQLSEILGKLRRISDGLKEAGMEPPLVCIDYLQFIDCDLTPDGELITKDDRKPDTAEAIKRTLQALKTFAMEYETIVWLIMANNRTSNKEGYASMDSGRDTSNIEYSGDVMLSLVYTAIEDKWQVPKGKDKDGNTKYNVCDLEFINDRIDFCRSIPGKDEPLVAKLQSLKVVKGRELRGRGVARFVYNGAFSTFSADNGIKNPYDERLTKTEDEEQKQFDKKEETLRRHHTLDELFARTEINGVASMKDMKKLSGLTLRELDTLIRQFPDSYRQNGDAVRSLLS